MSRLTSLQSDSDASNWVRRFAPLIPKNAGPVLDLACGGGRHTRLLLDQGYEVWAVDKEAILLQPLAALGARTFQLDLETEHQSGVEIWPFDRHHFAGVIVTNYLHRPLFPHLKTALSNNGVLIYETFAEGNAVFGRPRNPHFLLRSGELLQQLMSDIDADQQNQVLAYEQGYVETPHPAMVQRICLRSIAGATADNASYSLNRI